jgi:hypothetical protein
MAEQNRTGQANAASADHARRERLKLKLRENLKRRKSQMKERSRTAAVSSDGHQTSPDGEVGKPRT